MENGDLTGASARRVLKHVVTTGTASSLDTLLSDLGISPSSAVDLTSLCNAVIAKLPKEAEQVRLGKHKTVMRLVGEVMKESKGTADAQKARELLLQLLSR